jgi:hypothetical protein
MAIGPAAADPPAPRDLIARLFRGLYEDFDLRAINGIYIVVPKGVPCFTGTSLADIARQICDHDHPGPALPRPGPGRSPDTPHPS